MLLAIVALVCGVASAQMPEGYLPSSVSDMQLRWVVADGKNNVEVSFKAPTEMISEWDYSRTELTVAITKIELKRSLTNMGDYQTVATFDAPAAGAVLSWTDQDLPYGVYDYQAQVYVGEASDWPSSQSVIVGELPADLAPGEFTCTVDEKNPYQVILEVLLPSKNSLGETLTMPITKVEFGELGGMTFEPQVFYTEDAEEVLVPGTKLQFVVEKVTDGLHSYSCQVYTATGGNWPASTDVFIGKDQPGMAQNVVAQVTDEGIVVTWEAPTTGMNGGDQGDPAAFTYTVSRAANLYDANAVVIAKDIKELKVVDKTEFAEANQFVYIVTVKSPHGESYPVASNQLLVGPVAQLPYSENFDVPLDEWGNTTTEHSTWSKDYSGWFCAWQIGQETYVGNKMVKPHSGAGLLYAYYNSWGETHQWDSFTSGGIYFPKASEPELKFWLYDVAVGGSDVTLSIQYSVDGNEFATAQSIAIGNAEEEGWRQVSVQLPELKGAEAGKVRFLSEANGSNCVAVILDDIEIVDNNPDAIQAVKLDNRGIIYNQMGQRVGKNARGIVIINGKKILK